MQQSSILSRSLMAGAIAITGTVTAATGAFAQTSSSAGETLTSELTGWDVEIGGMYFTLDETKVENYEHGDGERFYFDGVDQTAFAELSFFDDSDTPDETIAIMSGDFEGSADAFELIAESTSADEHYQLASFEANGVAGYYYIQVEEDVDGNIDMMQIIYGTEETFVDDWMNAQTDITVDGQGFLSDPVAGDLDTLIEDGGSQTSTGSTSETTGSTRTTRGSLGSADSTPASETTGSTRTTSNTTETDATAAAGETSYTFELTDSVLETSGSVVISDTQADSSSEIVTVNDDAMNMAMVGYVEDNSTAAEAMDLFVDGMSTDGAAEELLRDDARSSSFGVYRMDASGTPMIVVVNIDEVEDGLFKIEVALMAESAVEEGFVNLQDNVTVDGDPFMADWDVQDILDVL